MKTIITTEASKAIESLKRLLYSFQVLMIGIAIPVLFMMGISTGQQKNQSETKIKTEQGSELTIKPGVEFPVVKI